MTDKDKKIKESLYSLDYSDRIIDGKKIADELTEKLKLKYSTLKKKAHLAVIQIGKDPSSTVYIKHKERICKTSWC